MRDAGEDRLFHAELLDGPDDRRAGLVVVRRAHPQGHVLAARVLDGAQVQHLGPARGHLEHLLVGDGLEQSRVADDARVGRVDAVDVGVDLADVGLHGGGHRHGRGVRATAAEGGDLLGVHADALEPRDEGDMVLGEGGVDAPGRDVDDPRVAVLARGHHPGLRPGERACAPALGVDRHGEQGVGDPLAGRQEHVELPRRRARVDLHREVGQLVGGVAHGGGDDHDVVAVLAGAHDPLGHPADALRVLDGRAAVLLDDECHRDGPPRTGR